MMTERAKTQKELEKKRKKNAKILRKFEVVAFGCHDTAHEHLQDFFRREVPQIKMFMFVEYFCRTPVAYPQWEARRDKGIEVFFPFIRRTVEENQFLWIPNSVPRPEDKASQEYKEYQEYVQVPKSARLLDMFHRPEQFCVAVKEPHAGLAVLEAWGTDDTAVDKEKVRRFDEEWQNTYRKMTGNTTDPAYESNRKEFALLGRPWMNGGKYPHIVTFPLATSAVFYGHFLIWLPAGVPPDEMPVPLDKMPVFRKVLRHISKEMYLPILTLLAESMLEDELAEIVKGTTTDEYQDKSWTDRVDKWFRNAEIPFLECNEDAVDPKGDDADTEGKPVLHRDCPKQNRSYDADYELPLHRCWGWRKQLLKKLSGEGEEGEHDSLEFLGRLPLAKYFVASPGLVENMKLVMGANFEMPTVTSSLPAALVYGGPGSGKDVMAQLVSVFSEEYFDHAVHTVNMAAIRPPAITGPLLQGLRLSGGLRCPLGQTAAEEGGDVEQRPYARAHMEGLFIEAKRLEQKRLKARKTAVDPGATFILDELNSLDVDLQGVLLRLLEQGEVMPLGGLSKAYVQHLIVGVVNEDPELTVQRKVSSSDGGL